MVSFVSISILSIGIVSNPEIARVLRGYGTATPRDLYKSSVLPLRPSKID